MYIFLDTNVFYNDWFLNNANFRYLFHYISNEQYSLLISDLVCEEAENIRSREVDVVKGEMSRQLNQMRKLSNVAPSFDSAFLDATYEIRSILSSKCENVVFVNYESVPHNHIVRKALRIEKPFLDGEKGYRDSLIWLSLLTFLRDNLVEEDVAFISNNKSDFFITGKEGLQLHPQLLDDVNTFNVKARIVPYDSLFKFVQAVVDKSAHAIDRAKTAYEAEEFLEAGAVDYIENAPPSWFRQGLIEAGVKPVIVSEITSIEAEIIEGVEDCDLMTYETLDERNVFAYFYFDLRIVYLIFKIPLSAYYAHKDVMDLQLINFDIEEEYVRAGICLRLYFDASCIYNPRDATYSNFTVANLQFKM
jgi:hypothetical protein